MRFGQQLRTLWMWATVILSDQHLGSDHEPVEIFASRRSRLCCRVGPHATVVGETYSDHGGGGMVYREDRGDETGQLVGNGDGAKARHSGRPTSAPPTQRRPPPPPPEPTHPDPTR